MVQAYSSVKAASEVVGGFMSLVVDLTMDDGSVGGTYPAPDSAFYSMPFTLHFSDHMAPLRRNTDTGDPGRWWYANVIMDWGAIKKSADFGAGLRTTADMQLILSNIKHPSQTYYQTSPWDEAVPTGAHEMRMSKLFQVYPILHATVSVKAKWYAHGYTDEYTGTLDDIMQEATLFTGQVVNVVIEHDTILLDVTHLLDLNASTVPGREITAAPFPQYNGRRVPVVYGKCTAPQQDLTDFDGVELAYLSDRFLMHQAVPWQRDSGTGWYLIWNDCNGPGEASQPDFPADSGGKSDASDRLVRYNDDTDTLALVYEQDPGGAEFVDDATANAELAILVNSYMDAEELIWPETVSTSVGLTNSGNSLSRDLSVYAELDLSSTGNLVEFEIQPAVPHGTIYLADDCLVAWIAVEAASLSGGPEVYFGLRETAGTSAWVGTPAELNEARMEATALYAQGFVIGTSPTVAGTVPAASLFVNNALQPAVQSWNWGWLDGAGAGGKLNVRVAVKTAGTGSLRIVGAGIYVYYRLATPSGVKRIGSLLNSWPVNLSGRVRGDAATPLKYELAALNTSVVDSGYYVISNKASLDDASGTHTGTAEENVQKPTEIVTSIIDRWNASGVVLTNKSTSAFGGSLLASEYIDDWADEAVSGKTWQHTLQIDAETPLGSAVDAVAQGVPLMVYLDPASSQVQFIGYPTAARTPTELRYNDSAGNRVQFHPNIPHPDTNDYFKPYALRSLSCRLNLEKVYNDFTVRYWEFAPTKNMSYTLKINKDDSNIWDGSAFTTDSTRESECQTSFDRWGHRPLTVELRGVHNHATAQGALDYLFTRGIAPLMLVTAEAHLEAYDLIPGKLVQFSNDCAKVFEPPKYDLTGGVAPLIDWEDFEFFVLDVELVPDNAGITVRILCEEKAE